VCKGTGYIVSAARDTPELRAQRAELKKARVLLERCVQELIRLGDPSEDAEPSPLQIEIERYLKARGKR
jgi:hypothetical protein